VRRRVAVFVLSAVLVSCNQGIVKTNGPNADAALDLMFHNKYAAATAQLQESLKSHPQDARLHADYALVLNYQTKQTQALEQALAAEKIAPGDAYVETIVTRVRDWNNDLAAAASAGGNSSRWCAGCPGCPPGWRRSWPGGGGGLGGLTMSEDGGLEEVEESLRAAASCFCNWATVARKASSSARKLSTSACNRWQLAHGGRGAVIMDAKSILPASVFQHCERLPHPH